MVELFNRYGLKGTFHLNSANYGRVNFLDPDEIRELYRGHEIAVHGFTHSWLERQPREAAVFEILEDRRRLEAITGAPVRGMSYPWGTVDDRTVETARSLGICYSRTIQSTNNFNLPEDFMRWNPTVHHNKGILEKIEPFRNARPFSLFYVWGHSFEFTKDRNWAMMEEFCDRVSGMDDVWFATNMEIFDYIDALRRVVLTADCTVAVNPSAIDVILEVNEQAVTVPAGKTVSLI